MGSYTHVSAAGVSVTAATQELARKVANFCDAKGITSNAQFNAAVDGLTLAQVKDFLKLLVEITP
jgi:hypothetical protein